MPNNSIYLILQIKVTNEKPAPKPSIDTPCKIHTYNSSEKEKKNETFFSYSYSY